MPDQIDWTEEGGEVKPKRGRKRKAAGEPAPSAESPAGPATRTQDESASVPATSTASAGAPAAPIGETEATEGSLPGGSAPQSATGEFGDVAHLTKKGLRVVTVVTGAVVDQAGNFLFYVDGHEDARSGVQAQINHQLDSGPAREEYLAPARTRARELLEKLCKPR